ncbi:MAG: FtsQ-type POTRA domain-containing protein [Atopobiaceae bacterium]|nr:FtsQ-type POTRA domain-containing protein [Atopobiaceae bacterium]MCH4120437.1 FtsQ-type POTRA domain-containing protein [Atopobiaceae bacterium]MCI1318511.1 FtsQ-type POTRA domain-containing protein [Atopobiaceae bacterium]MCI1388275.1 FtsQ-type POTRA domain-containing protein [Atopobiaceae bacterium]MCI1431475.1 FtsQ-type POTRA domain-containing protein [Atopobiaceae bacterium]
MALGIVAVVIVVLLVLSRTSLFTIESLDIEATDHLSQETIAQFADVPEGTTLLNVDIAAVKDNVMRDPWVESVDVIREFPDRLKIVVHERSVGYVVLMSSSNLVWYLGEDGSWIEPETLDLSSGQSADDVAFAKAQELGAKLITDVPHTVSPKAGKSASDSCIQAVIEYESGFSSDFSSQIVRYSAASEQAISCALKSGVLVSLGEPSDISSKEQVVTQILQENPDQVTYINVRVVSQPSYRKVDSDSVTAGSGETASDASSTDATTGSLTDATSQDASTDASTDASSDASSDAA